MATIWTGRASAIPKSFGVGVRRAAIVGLLALPLFWAALANGLNQLGRAAGPAALSRFWADGGRTLAFAAARLAQPGAPKADLDAAVALARTALKRDPTALPAVTALAQAEALKSDVGRADKLFAYSESLSRRDLMTQLWRIEQAVRRGDVTGALVHYDRALRTVPNASHVLFPVLVQATATPAVTRELSRLLARRPAWSQDFVVTLAQSANGSSQALADVLWAMRLTASPADRAMLAAGLGRLTADKRFAAAWALYARAAGGAMPLRDGGFERDPVLPPFDWIFADTPDLSAAREVAAGGGTRLVLRAENEQAGVFARQLLVLVPGRYTLSLSAGDLPGDDATQPTVGLACATDDRALASGRIAAGRHELRLDVPSSGCDAQWLTIGATATTGWGSGAPWVDNLAISPVRP